ncbi:MAG: nuclear transport factor 2 family protein, partial [Candidatus Marinimicrobia bacterium]|nr:nuclear transport factor 2 family protein [Candidatus Neomarinimicrobiota bacterium]
MSLLEKWAKAIELRDEDTMNECLHDDYKFTLHSAGKILSKSEVIAWGMS